MQKVQLSNGNREANFTRQINTATVTLPGFQGRTTKHPAEAEHRNTKKKKESKVAIISSDNCDLQ